MNIEDALEQNIISLLDMDISKVPPPNTNRTHTIEGAIAEQWVIQWLDRCGVRLDKDFPRSYNGHTLEKRSTGIYVVLNHGLQRPESLIKKKRSLHGYDAAFYWGGQAYVVEVKAYKLGGFTRKIARAIEYAKEFYPEDVQMLVFFPQKKWKKKDAINMESQHPEVTCIDLVYTVDEMDKAVKTFRDYQESSRNGRCIIRCPCMTKKGQRYTNTPKSISRARNF